MTKRETEPMMIDPPFRPGQIVRHRAWSRDHDHHVGYVVRVWYRIAADSHTWRVELRWIDPRGSIGQEEWFDATELVVTHEPPAATADTGE